MATLAFDVYGTLIDTHGLVGLLAKRLGERARAFSELWRQKQLEYSFRRGLMGAYQDFSVCTAQALAYANECSGRPLDEPFCRELLQGYVSLPAYPDVDEGLAAARRAGMRLFAFSNGRGEAVEQLLRHAGIRKWFEDVVSVDEVGSFKPDPTVYRHFLKRAGAAGEDAWMVSGNPFDVIGAAAAGMRTVWVRRSPAAVFDPWGIEPTVTVVSLAELAARVGAAAPV
ncbi:MAG: haloacid dehalogenase type II [Thermodesulfobacteriota bacterium]